MDLDAKMQKNAIFSKAKQFRDTVFIDDLFHSIPIRDRATAPQAETAELVHIGHPQKDSYYIGTSVL